MSMWQSVLAVFENVLLRYTLVIQTYKDYNGDKRLSCYLVRRDGSR
jgi:hypothetical protein